MPSDLSRLAALEQGEPLPGGERATPAFGRPVPGGVVASRRAVRRFGAFAALVVPAACAAVGSLLLWNSNTAWRGVPGFALLVAGAPVLPLTGVPAEGGSTRYIVAGAVSTVLWLVIGFVASRRSTELPVAGWADWRAEYRPLAIGAAVGGWCALGLWGLALRVGWA